MILADLLYAIGGLRRKGLYLGLRRESSPMLRSTGLNVWRWGISWWLASSSPLNPLSSLILSPTQGHLRLCLCKRKREKLLPRQRKPKVLKNRSLEVICPPETGICTHSLPLQNYHITSHSRKQSVQTFLLFSTHTHIAKSWGKGMLILTATFILGGKGIGDFQRKTPVPKTCLVEVRNAKQNKNTPIGEIGKGGRRRNAERKRFRYVYYFETSLYIPWKTHSHPYPLLPFHFHFQFRIFSLLPLKSQQSSIWPTPTIKAHRSRNKSQKIFRTPRYSHPLFTLPTPPLYYPIYIFLGVFLCVKKGGRPANRLSPLLRTWWSINPPFPLKRKTNKKNSGPECFVTQR